MNDRKLICTATLQEMDPWLSSLGMRFETLPQQGGRHWARSFSWGTRTYCLALTGAGIPLTIARLLPLVLEWSPAHIVNVGIAGAYPGSDLKLGELVAGESECFGDLGMESPDPEGFLPLSTMPWADEFYRQPLPLQISTWNWTAPGTDTRLPEMGLMRRGRGCTVNQCTGREATGLMRRTLFSADFESMEGAAVAMVGRLQGTPVSELRSISNFASTRDMQPANIKLALDNLGGYMGSWLGRTT